jgi:hypothetical protein
MRKNLCICDSAPAIIVTLKGQLEFPSYVLCAASQKSPGLMTVSQVHHNIEPNFFRNFYQALLKGSVPVKLKVSFNLLSV